MTAAKVPSSSLDKITAEFLEQKLAQFLRRPCRATVHQRRLPRAPAAVAAPPPPEPPSPPPPKPWWKPAATAGRNVPGAVSLRRPRRDGATGARAGDCRDRRHRRPTRSAAARRAAAGPGCKTGCAAPAIRPHRRLRRLLRCPRSGRRLVSCNCHSSRLSEAPEKRGAGPAQRLAAKRISPGAAMAAERPAAPFSRDKGRPPGRLKIACTRGTTGKGAENFCRPPPVKS